MSLKFDSRFSLFDKLLDIILEEIPSDRALLFFRDNRDEIIWEKSWPEDKNGKAWFPSKIIARALEEKHPVLIADLMAASSLLESGEGHSQDLGSALCLPLLLENHSVGALFLGREATQNPYTSQNLEFLIPFSKALSIAMRNDLGFSRKGNDQQARQEGPNNFFVGKSEVLGHIQALIEKVKDNAAPVFICGESGTGKELIARAVHETGARKRGQFVAVNCGAIPDHLLESELFGHSRGAFTGALRDKAGLIEEANAGTFFLDEVCDLSLSLQAKLLRVLQEKEIRRIGENRTRCVDVRFVSATNKTIETEIEQGRFREDLYYRLRIIAIEIPPLRERKEDILPLLNHFIEKYCREMRKERPYFTPRALEMLANYSWPGNVRELQNEIQRCLILSGEDHLIKEEYLSAKINPRKEISKTSPYNFFEAKAEFERRFLNQALLRFGHNKARTAGEIGLSRQGLFKLLKKHKIEGKESKVADRK